MVKERLISYYSQTLTRPDVGVVLVGASPEPRFSTIIKKFNNFNVKFYTYVGRRRR